MFAWANKTLANLAETIAPPASDSTHKFLAACSAQDEHAAMTCLTHPMGEDLPPLDPHGIVNPNKGTQPIHVACQYGLIDLVKTLITQYRVSPDAFDSGGNTPLHHAAMYSDGSPRHLDLVKMLVGEPFNASVVVKNSEGKSPYDVATGANVRNYLLPIQLQRETQACLDDGGRGLAPGIDLGGMKVNYSNHGAPPMAPGGGGAPGIPPPPHPGTPGVGAPAPSSGGLPQAGGAGGGPPSPYVAPPMGATGTGESSPMPPAASGDGAAAAAAATPGPPRPTADPASGAAGSSSGAPPTPAQAGPPAPLPPPPPAAPPSGGGGGARTYARHSSAPTSGNMKYRPDGFHSSSSDVALQEKYGHAKVDYSHIPPPPMSGGGGAGTAAAPSSSGGMPPPPGSGGGGGTAAPSSGGMPPPPYYGGGGGYSAVPTARAGSRYPVYDAVTDTHSLPPPPPAAAGGQRTPSPAPTPTPPAYSVFQPTATAGAGAQVHTQQPPAQQPPPHSGGYSAQPPPPQQQQPPHSGGYSAQPQHQQPIYSPPPVGTIPTAGVAVQHSFNQQAPPPQPRHQPTSPSAEEEDSFVS